MRSTITLPRGGNSFPGASARMRSEHLLSTLLMRRAIPFTRAPARRMPLVIQKPVLASGNRPTVEIRGRNWLRRLVPSPPPRRGLGRMAHTVLETHSLVVRSARLLLTQQMRAIFTCRLHAECAGSAPLPAVPLQIHRRQGRLSASSNRRTAARRLVSFGMAATVVPRHATGPTPRQRFAVLTRCSSIRAGTERQTRLFTVARSARPASPEVVAYGVQPTVVSLGRRSRLRLTSRRTPTARNSR